ncbi:serine carboxypeptidase [Pluteus cervinus]|uniref:Serine carboxypeptidase n=1 Tax=Pluteus cervinus TaxID=181527 RepID=A0ACD3B230_9AGAR|nr:serine carboxypeptidase [Pluteus cervinus]
MRLGLLTSAAFLTGLGAWAQQVPLGSSNDHFYAPGYSNVDSGLFTPLESLSAIAEKEFTTFGHPFFPQYSVRLKQSRFCDETVRAYTGYIDIQARHLFFYFFESRSDPDKDDVIFWTNGGPGCSSSLGLFMELGPCRVPDSNGTVPHPQSWNTNANVFFVDQPVGVGFSYAEYGEEVDTSEDAAKDIAAFVSIFFENFSKFKGRRFHMAGESYGGRYIPLFASAIYDQNVALEASGLTPINLVSAMIGNGMTDIFSMVPSYWDMQCTGASVPPVVDIATCVSTKNLLARCHKRMKESCVDQYDKVDCTAVTDYCNNLLSTPYRATGLNPYDISKPCEDMDALCYTNTKYITQYLSKPDVRSSLGVDVSIQRNFSSCSRPVSLAFRATGDTYHPTTHHIAALLERNVKVLIYVGTYDWVCNWVGNERWTLDLEWSGQEEFVGQPLSVWESNGKRAGRTRSAKGLTYATIEGAGHMVPYDKPDESLTLVQKWIADQPL